MRRSIGVWVVVTGLVSAACSGAGSESPSTTRGPEPVTTAAPTTVAPTTTAPASTTDPSPDAEGYPVSDEYTVETVLAGLDVATGGLAVDADGNLYHADFGYPGHDGDTVFKITPGGEVTPFASSDLMDSLTGNTFGPDGTLYQSSFGSSNVLTIAPDGTVELLTDQVPGPTGIVVTNDGRVFVESCRRSQVFEVFEDGSTELIAGGVGMNCPNGMTIDPDGNLYVVNFNAGFMHRITPDGEIEVIHRFPSGNAHVVYHEGFLFVTGRIAHRVYRYDLETGEVEIIVGTGDEGFVDGPGAEATIARPNAIAVGSDGTLYINHGGGGDANNPTYIRAIRRTG